MESEIDQTYINSDFFDKDKFQKQLDMIKKASELAQKKIDYFSAHDDNIIRAVDIVEDFLRKKHRLCYGGQAINAHLPAKYKFYDPEFSIPDYDFFTPDQIDDISVLVKDLKKAGFVEISVREGMHEGTIKIYVDYVPVADMTAIDPKLYRILSKREFRSDGISYLDANTLRMLMYLELSRPRGEVSRWSKVFERLALFNEFVPSKKCHVASGGKKFKDGIGRKESEIIINYIIDNKLIFAGSDLLKVYEHGFKEHKKKVNLVVGNRHPILFYSSDANKDANNIRSKLEFFATTASASASLSASRRRPAITIKSISSRVGDLIPSIKIITQGKKSIVIIIDQTACHSYFNLPMDNQKIIRIASMDTLISLYFSLGLINSKYFDVRSIECLANELINISIRAREHPDKFEFPFISIKCAGHQISLPSLIRAKVKRITHRKITGVNILDDNAKTDGNKTNKKRRNITVRH